MCTNGSRFFLQMSENTSLRFAQTMVHNDFIEGSLEVKLPTIWTDEKQSREEAERRERLEERREREYKKKEDADA